MKILTVVGARPQFIKASVISEALAAAGGVREVIVHTGQHYDTGLSDVFFRELGIPEPTHHLGIGSGPHGMQTGRMLTALEEVILAELPDWVLVYGDTNSTLAGALAAAKVHVPVAHVEAGLRSFNRRMPEEINRVLTDHLSDLLLTPTDVADGNLHREGIPVDRVRRVGDVMFDAALNFGARAEATSDVLDRFGLDATPFILATVHRAENTEDPGRIAVILDALETISRDLPVILPLHPRTRATLKGMGRDFRPVLGPGAVPPVGYLDMLLLERKATLVVTDSGGVQKEAYFAGTPCVTLRDETEWTELVDLGWNRLASPRSTDDVERVLRDALTAGEGQPAQPYGDGDAAKKIVQALVGSEREKADKR